MFVLQFANISPGYRDTQNKPFSEAVNDTGHEQVTIINMRRQFLCGNKTENFSIR